MKRKMIARCCFMAALVCAVIAMAGFLKEKNAGSSYDILRESVTVDQAPSFDAQVSDTTEASSSSVVSEAAAPAKTGGIISESSVAEDNPSDSEEAPVSEKKKPSADAGKQASDTAAKEDEEEIYIDFDKLQDMYPDVYAWLRVPGTDVDYPVVQSETDNTFYLSHNPGGEYEYAGAIFTENYNKKDFKDPHTVIYGHNMKNGTMFQTLHRFEDKEFFDEHREFEICLPDKILHYRIFAAYTYDDRHLLNTCDFDDESQFRLYLNEILRQKSMTANVDKSVKVTAKDRIVTLSTCNGVDNQRYLVQGVLLSDTK